MFLTLLYFTYYGVACVAITPNLMVAAILSGAFYGLMNLFAGFVIPQPEFPGWWIWVRQPSCFFINISIIFTFPGWWIWRDNQPALDVLTSV